MIRITTAQLAVRLATLCLSASAALAQIPCEPQRLVPPSAFPSSDYGISVATNGRYWFVGDRFAMTKCTTSAFSCATGAVHVYELVDGQLAFRQSIVPHDVSVGDNFGFSLDVDGDRLLVGTLQTRWPG